MLLFKEEELFPFMFLLVMNKPSLLVIELHVEAKQQSFCSHIVLIHPAAFVAIAESPEATDRLEPCWGA